MKVSSVVVTYNRLQLLIRVIAAIKSQTFRVDEIIVVNNSSTDGTNEWLSNQSDITVITQDNLGGAGGFNRGIKYAYDSNADWIWTMDDDVFPEPTALEELFRYSEISSCLIPTRYYSDNSICHWGGIYDLKRRRLILGTRPRDHKITKEYTFVNTCCFEGMLISRNIVSYIGFPDPRFFISGDDTVYGLLASQYTNILLVGSSILKRAKSSKDDLIPSPFYLYYFFRNYHLFEEYYSNIYDAKGFSLATRAKFYYEGYLAILKIIKSKKLALRSINAILLGIFHASRKKCGKTY